MAIINPTEEQLNEWLSQQTLRGGFSTPNRLADLVNEPVPMNSFRNNSTGRTVTLPSIQEQGGMSLDDLLAKTGATMKDKVDVQGYGPGFRLRGGGYAGLDPNGKMWELRPAPSAADQLAQLNFQMKQRQLEGLDLENQTKRKMLAGGSEIPKMKPGERWNAQEQRVEAVPGSDAYINQSGKHSKDYAAKQTVALKMGDAIDRVNAILNNKEQLEANFGGWNAMMTQYLPGAGLQGKNKIDQLKDVLKGAGLEMIRSGGSIGMMTEREWPIVERMIANINPTLSEEEARLELGKVAAYMKNIKDNAADAYQTEWGKTQFFKPDGGQAPAQPAQNPGMTVPVTSEADAMRLPPGTRFKLPDGRTGTAR